MIARRGPAELAERRGEQADAAVQVEVPGVGIHRRRRRSELVRDEPAERLRGQAVHLPEAAGIHAELAAADPLDDHLARLYAAGRAARRARGRPAARRLGTRDDAHAAVRGLHEVDAAGLAPTRAAARPLDRLRRERQVRRPG